MTKIIREKVMCKKCGKESEQAIVLSVNFLLGGRESNKKLLKDKQVCPHCGYKNKDISK